MIFRKRYRYRFGDIDHAGIAYYPALLHYFHCCFEDWWSDGLGHAYPLVMREDNYGLPAVKIDAEFFAPIRYGDEPEIALGVLALGESSVQLGFWMTLPGCDTPACRARITTVSVTMDTLVKRPIPPRWRERFAAFEINEHEFPSARPS